MTKIYLAQTDQLADPALFAQLYQTVPAHRREKIDAMKFPKGKQRCLGAWLLLMHGLKEAGIHEREIHLSYGSVGKPFLTDYPELFFNLSHSGNRVLCAVSDREVGCDVELVRSADFSVAKRFFSPQEYQMMINAPAEEHNAMFFHIWTLKESFIKNVGRGLSMPLREFCINLSGDDIRIEQQFLQEELFFRTFDLHDGYYYACCAREPEINDIQPVRIGCCEESNEKSRKGARI